MKVFKSKSLFGANMKTASNNKDAKIQILHSRKFRRLIARKEKKGITPMTEEELIQLIRME